MTRAQRAAQAKARQSKRIVRKVQPRSTAPIPFRPLPMNAAFWRDIEMMHLKCQRIAGYVPAERRDMDRGWR